MKVSVSSLGGAGEIGMNMYIYETERYALIVDCGVKFTKSDDPGLDLIIPDFSYIETIKEKEKLLVITHAHEDHIGAVGFLLRVYPEIMIASNRYSYNLLSKKLKEQNIGPNKVYYDDFTSFEWGDFEITPYPISHSIHGAYGIKIKVENNMSFLHISDYKIDLSPVTACPFPLKEFIEMGREGIDCLLADSTNILNKGFTKGEKQVVENIDKIFKNHKGRIFFTTFASNTERLQTVIDIAEKYGRKIVLEGSSIVKNVETARKYGKLKLHDENIISRKQMEKYDEDKLIFIATGSQGEGASVITKISEDDYSNIRVRKNDLFIFSSRIIPGNEHRIIQIINNIYAKGGITATADDSTIHVSGHASKEDGRLLLNIIRPTYLVPIHGEVKHLKGHMEMGIEQGMKEENVIFFMAGEKLVFENKKLIEKEEITAGKMYVDLNMNEIMDNEGVKLRKRLAINGIVMVVNTAEKNNKIEKENIIVETEGFTLQSEYKNELIEQLLSYNEREETATEEFKEFAEVIIKRFFKKRFMKKPVIKIIDTGK